MKPENLKPCRKMNFSTVFYSFETQEVCFPYRFLGSNLRILPVRNNVEIVKGMLTIAMVKMGTAQQI